jgi:hypothetical protein
MAEPFEHGNSQRIYMQNRSGNVESHFEVIYGSEEVPI